MKKLIEEYSDIILYVLAAITFYILFYIVMEAVYELGSADMKFIM